VPLAVVACGGGATQTFTVSGHVVSGIHGPLVGVLVHVSGRPAPTVTDADGAFVIDDVAVPYTLTVASTGARPWAHAFEGMTSLTPVVAPLATDIGVVAETTVRGTVFGGGPLPAGGLVVVCLEGRDFDVFGCAAVAAGGTHYDLSGAWFRPVAAAPARVHALWIGVGPDGQATSYPGYRAVDVTLSAAGSLDLDLLPELRDLAATSVQGAIGAVGGGVPQVSVVGVRLGDRLTMPVYRHLAGGVALDLALPEIGPGAYWASTVADFGTGRSYRWREFLAGDDLDLMAGPPPQLLAPAAGAVGVTSATVFRAQGGPSGARTFHWDPWAATGGPEAWLTTMSGEARMPDLTPFGLAFVPGGNYDWSVIASAGGVADALPTLLGTPVPIPMFGFGGPAFAGDGTVAVTSSRKFTLAP
jgi:hypothetical protein